MNLGAFAVLGTMSRDGDGQIGVVHFAGLAYRRPWIAGAMAFFLLGLAGLPPTAGFLGKLLLLGGIVQAGYAWLAVMLIIGTAISIYAYAKIIRAMFARVENVHVRDERPRHPLPWIAVAICALATLILGIHPIPLQAVTPLLR